MIKSDTFELTIENGSKLTLPEDMVRPFMEKGHRRVKVHVGFEGKHLKYHAALIKNKLGLYKIYLSKAKQKEMGVFMNDYFTVQLFEDQTTYGVEMPEVLSVVLEEYPDYKLAFESLSPGRKRSLIYTIKRYKSEQLKIDRTLLILENVKNGCDTPKDWLKKS